LIKVAYNLLARKTARSRNFIRAMDVFSGLIALWSLANIIVLSVSLAKQAAPKVRIAALIGCRPNTDH